MSWRRITVDGVEWSFHVGRTFVAFRGPQCFSATAAQIKGITDDDVQRGRWKVNVDGMVRPAEVAEFLRARKSQTASNYQLTPRQRRVLLGVDDAELRHCSARVPRGAVRGPSSTLVRLGLLLTDARGRTYTTTAGRAEAARIRLELCEARRDGDGEKDRG